MDKRLGFVAVVGGLLVGGLYWLWRNAGTVGQALEAVGAQMKTLGNSPLPTQALDEILEAAREKIHGGPNGGEGTPGGGH